MYIEIDTRSPEFNINENSHQETFKISVSGSPGSCLVKIGKQRFRTLVNTGAECSLMDCHIYEQLKYRPKLLNKKVCLHSANGTELKCDGCISVHICIGVSGLLCDKRFEQKYDTWLGLAEKAQC